jgi:DNA-binding transcriptional LysR family regulator
MNYTLHHLQIFLEVVRQQSVTKAAEEMHMTQPALSIQLKNFQNHFDIPLTEKIGKRLQITDFGYTIAELAENVIQEADAIRYKTAEYNGLFAGKLKISSASTGKYVIPFFLSPFLDIHPGIDLELDVSNKNTVLQHLKNNEVDFALVSVLPDDMEVNEEILLENKLYLVGDKPDLDGDRPLIYREEGSATGIAMNKYFGNEKERKKLKLTSNEAVKQAVIAGLGYSILPIIGIKNEISNGQLHIIDAKGLPMVTNWRIIWLKKKKLAPISKAFLQYIRGKKYEIIQNEFSWYLNFMNES